MPDALLMPGGRRWRADPDRFLVCRRQCTSEQGMNDFAVGLLAAGQQYQRYRVAGTAHTVRARQVAVIDMRYWQYRPGGKNLAFGEAIAQDFGSSGDTPPDTTPLQVYRQVRAYHDRYPDKAIVAWRRPSSGNPPRSLGWCC